MNLKRTLNAVSLITLVSAFTFVTNDAFSENQDFYMRCKSKPLEITGVNHGITKGKPFRDYVFKINYSNAIDLRKSEKPELKINDYKVYIVQRKNKKLDISYEKIRYRGLDTITFIHKFESKEYVSYRTLILSRVGGPPMLTGAVSVSEVEKGKVNKYRYTHTGFCKEITKKEFKKPIDSKDFKIK